MENQETKLTLYQKLIKIQQRINGLSKDGNGYNYKYVSGDKVIGQIKPIMNELGILLKQEIISIENTRQDYTQKGAQKSEILSKVMMKFTWIDSDTGEKDENIFGANGQNDWEKGLGSALTYAERYFFLKFFHIATDEDDIDNPDRKQEEPKAKTKTPATAASPNQPTPSTPVDKKPLMTEDQKNTLIKQAAQKHVFNDQESKVILEWIVQPRTSEAAQKYINRNVDLIKQREDLLHDQAHQS